MLSKVRPKQLVERIDQFKLEKDDIYQFSKYQDDEFWIVADVDKNWSNEIINPDDSKTYNDEWNEAIAMCQEKNYKSVVPGLTHTCPGRRSFRTGISLGR